LENRVPAAFGLILFAMTIIGLIDNYVRLIAEDAGLFQFHFLRGVMAIPMILAAAWWFGMTVRPKRIGAVALRSLATTVSMFLYFGSLAIVPVANAGAGLFTSPIFVLLISALVLRQPVGLFRILAVGVGFAGVLLVLRPGGEGVSFTSAMPVLAGAFYAVGAVMTRRICAGESTMAILLGMFVTMTLAGGVGLAVLTWSGWGGGVEAGFFAMGWQPPTPRFWMLTLVQAVGSLIAVYCITRAYLIAEAAFVGVFEYMFLLTAGFWGWLLWRQLPDLVTTIGIVLIVCAGAVIVLRSRPDRARVR